MRSVRVATARGFVLVLTLALAASAPAAGLLAGDALPLAPPQTLDVLDPLAALPGQGMGLFSGDGDFEAWLTWSESVPLDALQAAARLHAAPAGQLIVPAPDSLPGYQELGDALQREAWRAWWIASLVAAARTPDVPLAALPPSDTPIAAGAGADAHGGGSSANLPGGAIPALLGDPRGLSTLWRLEAHGAPHRLLPAGPDGATYLVTDLGVLYLPARDARPDWILRLDGVPGHAEVTPAGDGGKRDLVIGTHEFFLGAAPSIQVVDGAAGRVVWRGLAGEEALLHWRLTDVDGDGRVDILGLDVSGNITAVKLDGTRIYREPVPMPDLPVFEGVPIMPGFLAIALQRTGGIAFGDATGDGTLDLFTVGIYWATTGVFLDPAFTYVTLISGATGEAAWTALVEPDLSGENRMVFPLAAGDLDGDGLADVAVMQVSFGGILFVGPGSLNLVLSGADGLLLARDDGRAICLLTCDPIEAAYEPIAIVDLDGNGESVIIGLERGQYAWQAPTAIVVRSVPLLPGLPTELVDRYEVTLGAGWFPYAGYVAVRTDEATGASSVTLYSAQAMFGQAETGTIYTVDGSGFREVTPPEPLGHVDVDTATGQRYAWTLDDDRWVAVDDALSRQGDGIRLLRSVTPIVFHDQDGDGVPDVLLRRSLGYHWVSGRTGQVSQEVTRPIGTTLAALTMIADRPAVVEREAGSLLLFDLERQEVVWRIAATAYEGSHLVHVADLTGGGEPELLFFELPPFEFIPGGGQPERGDPRWWVYAPGSAQTLWEMSGEVTVAVRDVIPGRSGMELLVVSESGGDHVVTLRVVGEQGARWEHRAAMRLSIGEAVAGHVLVARDGGNEGYAVLDGAQGRIVAEVADIDGVWARLMPLSGAKPHLVYSRSEEIAGMDGALMQFLAVKDTATGEERPEVRLVDPQVRTVHYEFFGHRFSLTTTDWAMPGPVVGDWDDDGWGDIALREAGWPLVRSARSGDVLALSPRQGTFVDAVDLNGDGRLEVAMRSGDGGSLRFFAFDASQVLEREDPLQRIDDADLDIGGNRTGFFDEKGAPAPGLLLVLSLTLGLLAAARRRAESRR